MNTFKLPPPPREDHPDTEIASSDSPESWEREIRLPVDDEILSSIEIGGKVQVTLEGVVTAASKDESEHRSSKTMSITVTEIAVQSGDESDANYFESGFDDGPSKRY